MNKRLSTHDYKNMNSDLLIVEYIIKPIIEQSKKRAFRLESEIQAFTYANLNNLIGTEYTIEWDHPTNMKYVRDGTGTLTNSKTGRVGNIDLIITRKEPGSQIGIELEYPRGSGLREKNEFINHISNDILKLNEFGFDISYVLLFMYNDPNFNIQEEVKSFNLSNTRIGVFRLAKKNEGREVNPLMYYSSIPNDWFSL